jgi:hypothetical protein
VDACASILQEATRVQISSWRQYRGRIQRMDWVPWNEALAMIQLVGHHDMVAAAHRMDAVFWRSSSRIESGEIATKEDWAAERDTMESARLDFINTARRHLVEDKDRLTRLVARPPLSELPPRWTLQPPEQEGSREGPRGSRSVNRTSLGRADEIFGTRTVHRRSAGDRVAPGHGG